MWRLLLFFLFSNVLSAQTPTRTPNYAKPGKCYAKCMTDPIQTVEEQTFAVYTGTDKPKRSRVRERTVYTTPYETKWVKRPAEQPCLSADPADCLVWCLVRVGGDPVTFYEVKNIKKTPEYEMRTIAVVVKEEGLSEWQETVCGNKQTIGFVRQVQDALSASGDFTELKTGIMDTATKSALTAFQRREQLPIGSLNKPTVEALGLRMP